MKLTTSPLINPSLTPLYFGNYPSLHNPITAKSFPWFYTPIYLQPHFIGSGYRFKINTWQSFFGGYSLRQNCLRKRWKSKPANRKWFKVNCRKKKKTSNWITFSNSQFSFYRLLMSSQIFITIIELVIIVNLELFLCQNWNIITIKSWFTQIRCLRIYKIQILTLKCAGPQLFRYSLNKRTK